MQLGVLGELDFGVVIDDTVAHGIWAQRSKARTTAARATLSSTSLEPSWLNRNSMGIWSGCHFIPL